MKREQPRRRPVVATLGRRPQRRRHRPPPRAQPGAEPRDALGRGLAYSTADPAHRINGPASKMTLINSDLYCVDFGIRPSDSGIADSLREQLIEVAGLLLEQESKAVFRPRRFDARIDHTPSVETDLVRGLPNPIHRATAYGRRASEDTVDRGDEIEQPDVWNFRGGVITHPGIPT